jgi:hypothetical protein
MSCPCPAPTVPVLRESPHGSRKYPNCQSNSLTERLFYSVLLDCVWNVMAHAQKPDFVFRRNGRVYLNRREVSVQSTAGSRGVRISGSNAGYTMFRGSVKSTGYPLHSTVFPSLPLPCVTVCHQVSNALYHSFPRSWQTLFCFTLATCIWEGYATDNSVRGNPRGSRKKTNAGKFPTGGLLTAVLCRDLEKNGMVGAWHGRGMGMAWQVWIRQGRTV